MKKKKESAFSTETYMSESKEKKKTLKFFLHFYFFYLRLYKRMVEGGRQEKCSSKIYFNAEIRVLFTDQIFISTQDALSVLRYIIHQPNIEDTNLLWGRWMFQPPLPLALNSPSRFEHTLLSRFKKIYIFYIYKCSLKAGKHFKSSR